MTHPAVWLSYAVFMILLWAVILKFWEKIGYRFSLEWILVKATAPQVETGFPTSERKPSP